MLGFRKTGGRRQPIRPSVTILEDRLAPAVLTVNSLLDGPVSAADSTLTLREAIALIDTGGTATDASGNSLATAKTSQINTSNSFGVNDTIQFAPTLFGATPSQIVLANGSLLLNRDATISGPGASQLAVSGNNQSAVFAVAAGATVSISDVTVEAGAAAGNSNGGGIDNLGTLTLTDTVVSGNSAAQSSGGGIYNSGTLTLANSTVSDNRALSNAGIYNSGTLTLTDSTVSGNTANLGNGGLANYGGTMTLIDSTVSGNTAEGAGGLGNYDSGTTTLLNTAVTGNSAGNAAGLVNFATMTLTNSTVSDNAAGTWGGGILNFGTMTMTNSTALANTANIDGGIGNQGTLKLTNSLVTGNTANLGSGGLDNTGTLTLVESTISGNTEINDATLDDMSIQTPAVSIGSGNKSATSSTTTNTNTSTPTPTDNTVSDSKDSASVASSDTGTRTPTDSTSSDNPAASNAAIFNTAASAVIGTSSVESIRSDASSGAIGIPTLAGSVRLVNSTNGSATTSATPPNEGTASTGTADGNADASEDGNPLTAFDNFLTGRSAEHRAVSGDSTGNADNSPATAVQKPADGAAEKTAPAADAQPEMDVNEAASVKASESQPEGDRMEGVVLIDRESGFRAEWTPGYLAALLLPWFSNSDRSLKAALAKPQKLPKKEDRL